MELKRNLLTCLYSVFFILTFGMGFVMVAYRTIVGAESRNLCACILGLGIILYLILAFFIKEGGYLRFFYGNSILMVIMEAFVAVVSCGCIFLVNMDKGLDNALVITIVLACVYLTARLLGKRLCGILAVILGLFFMLIVSESLLTYEEYIDMLCFFIPFILFLAYVRYIVKAYSDNAFMLVSGAFFLAIVFALAIVLNPLVCVLLVGCAFSLVFGESKEKGCRILSGPVLSGFIVLFTAVLLACILLFFKDLYAISMPELDNMFLEITDMPSLGAAVLDKYSKAVSHLYMPFSNGIFPSVLLFLGSAVGYYTIRKKVSYAGALCLSFLGMLVYYLLFCEAGTHFYYMTFLLPVFAAYGFQNTLLTDEYTMEEKAAEETTEEPTEKAAVETAEKIAEGTAKETDDRQRPLKKQEEKSEAAYPAATEASDAGMTGTWTRQVDAPILQTEQKKPKKKNAFRTKSGKRVPKAEDILPIPSFADSPGGNSDTKNAAFRSPSQNKTAIPEWSAPVSYAQEEGAFAHNSGDPDSELQTIFEQPLVNEPGSDAGLSPAPELKNDADRFLVQEPDIDSELSPASGLETDIRLSSASGLENNIRLSSAAGLEEDIALSPASEVGDDRALSPAPGLESDINLSPASELGTGADFLITPDSERELDLSLTTELEREPGLSFTDDKGESNYLLQIPPDMHTDTDASGTLNSIASSLLIDEEADKDEDDISRLLNDPTDYGSYAEEEEIPHILSGEETVMDDMMNVTQSHALEQEGGTLIQTMADSDTDMEQFLNHEDILSEDVDSVLDEEEDDHKLNTLLNRLDLSENIRRMNESAREDMADIIEREDIKGELDFAIPADSILYEEDHIVSEPEAESEIEPELKPEPTPKLGLEAEKEPGPASELKPEAELEPELVFGPEAGKESGPAPELKPVLGFGPEAELEPVLEFRPEAELEPVPETGPEAELEPVSEFEPQAEKKPELELVPELGPAPELEPVLEFEPEPVSELTQEPAAIFEEKLPRQADSHKESELQPVLENESALQAIEEGSIPGKEHETEPESAPESAPPQRSEQKKPLPKYVKPDFDFKMEPVNQPLTDNYLAISEYDKVPTINDLERKWRNLSENSPKKPHLEQSGPEKTNYEKTEQKPGQEKPGWERQQAEFLQSPETFAEEPKLHAQPAANPQKKSSGFAYSLEDIPKTEDHWKQEKNPTSVHSEPIVKKNGIGKRSYHRIIIH